jgi:hypothetical protein
MAWGSAGKDARYLRKLRRLLANTEEGDGKPRVVDPYGGTQVGVAPDGSVLLTRDVGTQEVYALNVK